MHLPGSNRRPPGRWMISTSLRSPGEPRRVDSVLDRVLFEPTGAMTETATGQAALRLGGGHVRGVVRALQGDFALRMPDGCRPATSLLRLQRPDVSRERFGWRRDRFTGQILTDRLCHFLAIGHAADDQSRRTNRVASRKDSLATTS